MKLLLDQNLSFRVVAQIKSEFPAAQQIRSLGLENATDSTIWEFAREHGFTIVTFDADFLDLAYVKGCPPKIIWLRTGNMSTNAVAKLLLQEKEVLRLFVEDKKYADAICLEIS